MVEHLGIVFHGDGHLWSCCHRNILETDVGDNELCALVGLHGKVTVEIGHGYTLAAYADSGTDDGFASSILNVPVDSNLLRKGTR